ncbi:MAG: SUMF1/EgtB/PvdO family nonheme iron enzyme [Octadecabacter sp.]
MKLSRAIAALLGTLMASPASAQSIDWQEVFYDPGAAQGERADLILPLPCGGAMSFQRIDVPVDATDPLDDRKLRLGRSDRTSGYSEFLRFVYLRGPFVTPDSADTMTHFYMARYELTVAQLTALNNAQVCDAGSAIAPPLPLDRLSATGLSWFDAVALGQRYTEWLIVNAPDQIPGGQDGRGYLRLPTEVEWEFSARGGTAVSTTDFAAPQFPMMGRVDDYARFQGAGGASPSRAGPTGSVAPNPLGLFDMYGNAEELILEPFRLNALGRAHGQSGGLVTRGGSYLSVRADMYSAHRKEWQMYARSTGLAQAQPTFGIRFVIAADVSRSDAFVRDFQSSWQDRFDLGPSATVLPTELLRGLIDEEIDPARRASLEALELEFSVNERITEDALDAAVRAALFSGSMTKLTIADDMAWLPANQNYVDALGEYVNDPMNADQPDYEQYRAAYESTAAAIPVRQARLDAGVSAYRSQLDLLIDPDQFLRMSAVLPSFLDELQLAGQFDLIPVVSAFVDDVNNFSNQPDMTTQDLIDLATN